MRVLDLYKDFCGFPRPITEADIEMLCNCSYAGLFRYDLEAGAEEHYCKGNFGCKDTKKAIGRANHRLPMMN